WQPSDVEENLPGIREWVGEAQLPNVLPPIALDVRGPWPPSTYSAVFSANAVHIMGWPAVEAMFAGIGKVLEPGGVLALYGPFNYGGKFTSESNERFDRWLKMENPESGVRDFEALDALARGIGLRLARDYAMPANNRTLVWRS
ncbi:MAG: DUF938 domain-containing protein, partial [Bdellovibrionota bacterium]